MDEKGPSKIRILHIEDDIEFAESNAFLMGDEFVFSFISTLADTYGEIERFGPDIIYLDLDLSGVGTGAGQEEGISLLQNLREDGKVDIPIVIISSHTSRSLIAQCIDLGASYFTSKPVNITNLKWITRTFAGKGVVDETEQL
ncbi:MAG: response regulator [candidate division Zixibacteria bacterium]|nr:response regulator [candidate division Zixibacteria bacterium]